MDTRKPLKLTATEFMVGAQQIVLSRRYGRRDEEELNHRFVQSQAYRLNEELLSQQHREIDCARTMEVNGFPVELSLKRFYEHENYVCRLVYLHEVAGEMRKIAVEPPELQLLELAGWIASKYYAQPPSGLRIYYHVLSNDPREAAVKESWFRQFPLGDNVQVEQFVAEKIDQIRIAFDLLDEDLPNCTDDQRHATADSPYRKCRDFCPARFNCTQFAAYLAAGALRNETNDAALVGINPGA